MKKLIKIFFSLTICVVIYSCSVNKDAFLNRKYHAVKTQYNVLFNGQQAFEKGLKQIRDNHKDNFWKRLPIEPITFDERKIEGPKFQTTKESETKNSNASPFDKAEEKARKAIETHSMNINGYEKNSKIDDAYLLLGKARYYTQRFIPAIDAYNYIISNYPDANLNYETRVWRAKANTRLGNEEVAIETMNLLMEVLNEKEEIPERIKEQAHTAMAMAYAETDTIQKVIKHLTKATETFYNKEQTARNMFILGQVYSELGRKDSARMVFKKLANTRKAPEKYRVHANIELVKNAARDSSDVLLIKKFKKLIRNSDNRKYYDELYYQIGTLYEDRGNTENAVDYYKKSLHAKNGSRYQKTYTFERLGNIYFDSSDYLLAGSYYDSVMQVVPKEFENEKRIRKVKRKNKGITVLKKHEAIVKNNDSILQLVSMTNEERTLFFEKHIEKLKKEEEEQKQQLLNAQNFGSNFGGGTSIKNNTNRGKWYFYNTQSIQFGKAEFERVWGNRPLEDNWRWSDKTVINSSSALNNNDKTNKVDSKYELSTYLKAIPTDIQKINKLKKERNDALYTLGLTYKERFKNNNLAIKNLERLQGLNTDEKMNLPINYHLYQLYSSSGKTSQATICKNFILEKYPSSKFAEIIKSPNKKLSDVTEKEDEIAKKYKKVYYLYKNGKYEEVVNQINNLSQSVDKSELIPKFALLKALSIGKYKSKDEYKKALEFIAFSYPTTDEGKKAQEIINLLK